MSGWCFQYFKRLSLSVVFKWGIAEYGFIPSFIFVWHLFVCFRFKNLDQILSELLSLLQFFIQAYNCNYFSVFFIHWVYHHHFQQAALVRVRAAGKQIITHYIDYSSSFIQLTIKNNLMIRQLLIVFLQVRIQLKCLGSAKTQKQWSTMGDIFLTHFMN